MLVKNTLAVYFLKVIVPRVGIVIDLVYLLLSFTINNFSHGCIDCHLPRNVIFAVVFQKLNIFGIGTNHLHKNAHHYKIIYLK